MATAEESNKVEIRNSSSKCLLFFDGCLLLFLLLFFSSRLIARLSLSLQCQRHACFTRHSLALSLSLAEFVSLFFFTLDYVMGITVTSSP